MSRAALHFWRRRMPPGAAIVPPQYASPGWAAAHISAKADGLVAEAGGGWARLPFSTLVVPVEALEKTCIGSRRLQYRICPIAMASGVRSGIPIGQLGILRHLLCCAQF